MMLLKKWYSRKPLSVFKSVIYLRNLPPGIGRAVLICRYIWSCRPGYRTRCMSPCSVVGSYPAFSPLPVARRFFSVTSTLKITPYCAFRRRVPCPVRTFLGFPRQIVLPLFWTAKLAFIGEKSKRILNLGVFIPPGEPELYELETELGVPLQSARLGGKETLEPCIGR